MIGFMEQLNRDFVGLHLDPDHAVIGEMLAEKYGLRFREHGDEIELRFLSRPLPAPPAQPAGNNRTTWAVWPGARRTRRYNASVCIRVKPGDEETIRSVYMKDWIETERGDEAANLYMPEEDFFRGLAVLQEYLDSVAVSGHVADCRWRATA
jgi:hypothetical protein